MRIETLFFLEKLADLKWLCRIGNSMELDCRLYSSVSSRISAEKSLISHKWEGFRLMLSNRSAYQLNQIDHARYKTWNPTVAEIKKFMFSDIHPKIKNALSQNIFSEKCINDLNWDILMMAMETEFSDVLKIKFSLDRLYPIYVAGHLPCGWTGPKIDEQWAGASA